MCFILPSAFITCYDCLLLQVIGYTFREKSFLLQAFTHSTFDDSDQPRLTESYEQLEFLGDAVIDFLITRHLVGHSDLKVRRRKMLKTILVSNSFFASVLTSHQLENHVLHNSSSLHYKIRDYIEAQWWDEAKPQIGHDLAELVLEHNVLPKMLGDVFESLLGAVFVDSGHDLEVVWRVFNNLCRDLDQLIVHPVRMATLCSRSI